jgi:hypothetical protein
MLTYVHVTNIDCCWSYPGCCLLSDLVSGAATQGLTLGERGGAHCQLGGSSCALSSFEGSRITY